MQINFSDYDFTDFRLLEGTFGGQPAILINPKSQKANWNKDNLIFRSSIWSPKGELLSASFPKFFNYGEPGAPKMSNGLDDYTFVEKIDGSTLILDYVNGKINARTRGSFSVNPIHEDEVKTYLINGVEDFVKSMPNCSIIFEHYSPRNKIILDYGRENKFWLTGMIDKKHYFLHFQSDLDSIAKEFGIRRPQTAKVYDFCDLKNYLNNLKDEEGFCAYDVGGQDIVKFKTPEYLKKHYSKSTCNFNVVLERFLAAQMPERASFEREISKDFDFETLQYAQTCIQELYDFYNFWKREVEAVKNFVLSLNGDRKSKAAEILKLESPKRELAFHALSGKEFNAQNFSDFLRKVRKNACNSQES